MSWISYPAKSLAPQKPATTFSVGVANNFGRKNYLYEPVHGKTADQVQLIIGDFLNDPDFPSGLVEIVIGAEATS